MRILTALTYYRPHTSGLTIYAERLARALVRRGHEVTVLTSRYDRSLAREEVQWGVRIVRAPVVYRISKGVIMPTIGVLATRLVLRNDMVHLHLPQFDAAGIALRGRLLRRPTVLTYHCDLTLPGGLFNAAVNQVVHVMNRVAALAAWAIVSYTSDFAQHSPYLRRYAGKVRVIPPPVELPGASTVEVQQFGRWCNPRAQRPVIAMATRLASEKGVEVLLAALPGILQKHPGAIVLFAGQHEHVMGEEAYARRLLPAIGEYEAAGHWRFLGMLSPAQMAAFYPNLDVLVVSSLNSTESFGLVQIEAMMNGVPVVASDLPGVRQPVLTTGMGRIVPPGDADALAEAVLAVLAQPRDHGGRREDILRTYDPGHVAAQYEELFESLRRGGR